ncbi:O-antigen ligase [Halomonas sp. HAL1]|uniref:O-antigen ligase family protein n=1 Tax=Halomonas sp. HAL1 TaxID=550984 RepID=UPI00022D330B|nr:O-antigen ligase family protein [Halomonas sp. HAL1]EHA13926.1 O-antigen polymerase [Halomonas sp. HAL1]WKV94273.1 O-antigen ligase family protein [Halomonas sp. HAL1]
MLVLGSISLLVQRPALNLDRRDGLLIGSFFAYIIVHALEAWWDSIGISGIDRPSRLAMAIPAMFLIIACPPRLAFLWSGLAFGAITTGSWAGWQKIIEESDRASGYTHVIQFGNLSMLVGVLCLAGLGWAMVQQRRNMWVCFLLLGAAFGILGSLFSGSRGGWIGFPIVLWVLYRAYGRHLANWLKFALVMILVGASILVYTIPQAGVQHRVHQAFNDVSQYASGDNRVTSVGSRFEMWRGAGHMISEKPLFGWGENGYREQMSVLASEGVVESGILRYGHAHNEMIDAFAKRGIVGVIVLLLLYLVPLRLFARHFSEPDIAKRSLAVAGVLLPVTYIDFGLTQTFLSHNSGIMIYAFWIAVLWGTLKRQYITSVVPLSKASQAL